MVRQLKFILFLVPLVGFLACTSGKNATESAETQPVPIKGTNVRGVVAIQDAYVSCSTDSVSLTCKLVTNQTETSSSTKSLVTTSATGEPIDVIGLLDGGSVSWTKVEEQSGGDALPIACTKSANGFSIRCLLGIASLGITDLIMNAVLSNSKGEREEEFDKESFLATAREVEAYEQVHTADATNTIEEVTISETDYDTVKRHHNGENMCPTIIAQYSTNTTTLATKPEILMSEFALCRYNELKDDGDSSTNECTFLNSFIGQASFSWMGAAMSSTLAEAIEDCRPPAPVVAEVTPNEGLVGVATNITVTGTGFAENSTVTIGAMPCNGLNFVSSTTLTCTTPPYPMTGPLTVTVANSTATNDHDDLANGFTYRYPAPPDIDMVTPSSGPFAGGTIITITGTGFTGTSSVNVGALPCTSVTLVDANTLRCATPSGMMAASVGVRVRNSALAEDSDELNNAFTYQLPPITISSADSTVNPLAMGAMITIHGTGFMNMSSPRIQQVRINNMSCMGLTVSSDTRLTCNFNTAISVAQDFTLIDFGGNANNFDDIPIN